MNEEEYWEKLRVSSFLKSSYKLQKLMQITRGETRCMVILKNYMQGWCQDIVNDENISYFYKYVWQMSAGYIKIPPVLIAF